MRATLDRRGHGRPGLSSWLTGVVIRGPLRLRGRGGLRGWLRRTAAGRDVGLAYATVVVAGQIALSALSATTRAAVLAACSTNLANLREHPPLVLGVSAFVLASPWELVLLPVLVYAYGAVQRWLGRTATVIMAVLAHLGACVFVATMLAARVHRGEVSASVAGSVDVGVSYGLAGILGLLTARAPDRVRRWLIAGVSLALLAVVVLTRSFDDLGHLAAWGIGVAVATLVRRGRMGLRDDVASPS